MTKIVPEKQEMRIGELLVKEGFLDKASLEKALQQQALEKELQGLPVGQILLKTGDLSDEHLQKLLQHSSLKHHLGSLAIEAGMISDGQLADCLSRQRKGQPIGEMLVEEKLLSSFQVQELLKKQMDAPRLWEMAVKLGYVSKAGLQKAQSIQKCPRNLGEIVVDLGLVTPLDLCYVLNKYKKFSRLGEILLRNGYVDENALKEALQEQNTSSSFLGDILVRQKMLSRSQLLEALSRQSNIPFHHLDNFVYSAEQKKTLKRIISQKFAEKNLMIPISLKQRDLTIAFFRTETIGHARELREIYTQFKLHCILITEERFSELFEILYSSKLHGVTVEEGQAEEQEDFVPEQDFMQIELSEDIGSEKEGPIYAYSDKDIEAEELVNYIINYGINKKASDIHVEQDRAGAHLRFRIDGVLREVREPWLRQKLQQKVSSVVSRIKVIANLDIAEKRLPQDGVFRINYLDKASGGRSDLDFRVATCRAITGENVTIRILDSRKAKIGLDNLSHSPHVLEPFKRLLHSSAGIILVTGPTGSGKSSSLYAALQYIYNPSIKIITAEDPIEYSFPGVMQTQVNTKINLTFSRLLRSFLRLDPDVILIGEMRDNETAQIGFDAAQTGHLVLSTLHTNDAVSSISRLQDLDIELSQIAACLLAILAQRLLRRSCSSCRQPFIPPEEEWRLLFDAYPSHLSFQHGIGCDVCGHTGYSGPHPDQRGLPGRRFAVAEHRCGYRGP